MAIDINKIDRNDLVTYLDTTPSATATYALLGIGITSYGIAYNPQVETEKWIINKNATNEVSSVQKQGDVSQKMYKNDPCFEFAHGLRGKTGSKIKTNILDIDMWDEVTEGKYKAELSEGILAVTNKGAEDAVLEYSLYYNGDAKEGTVTFDVDGKPIFTENGSL